MDLRTLNYFLAVAREESITKAAEALHMTQPPLSRQIMELEAELGRPLLVRGSRRITLTEEGLLLRERARELIALAEKTKADIAAAENTVAGDITIGAAETAAMRPVIRAARALQKTHPRLTIHISSGNAEYIRHNFERGLFDFGVLIEPVDLNIYDFLRLPARDTWGVLMRKDDPLAEKPAVTAADLLTIPLIVSDQHLFDSELSGWLGYPSDALRIIATYNLLYNASLMVEEGEGYALALSGIIPTAEGNPLTFRPLAPAMDVGVCLVWRKYHIHPRPAALFLRTMQDMLRGGAEMPDERPAEI